MLNPKSSPRAYHQGPCSLQHPNISQCPCLSKGPPPKPTPRIVAHHRASPQDPSPVDLPAPEPDPSDCPLRACLPQSRDPEHLPATEDRRMTQRRQEVYQLYKTGETLYEVLELPQGATPEEISKAYRKLARKYHPDKNPEDPNAAERFKEINAAHSVLADPDQRHIYNLYGDKGLYMANRYGPETLKVYFIVTKWWFKVCIPSKSLQYLGSSDAHTLGTLPCRCQC
ncbi:dnaJ homolog subfamily C member 5G isoform X2 [Dromiciops gliroides]|uniref:dnaJ homolog subfamily C member 5G isoform X2 n=1 Tax=Dromiciops gliroides TaxID=33562 RepID=UPI001CC55E1A|nr:dnaJ homolog subfamily C member 5G isoform X2 [Dromiciops gliroides]